MTLDKTKKTASWHPKYSGGIAFTDKPLLADDVIIVTFEGSGAIELGLTTTDPSDLSNDTPISVDKLADYRFLNDIKLHRRSCTLHISLDESKQVMEIEILLIFLGSYELGLLP